METGTAVPLALREAKRWIVWRHLDGRKPPVGPDGRPLANWNDPASWMSYDEAVQVFAASELVDGVGFVLGTDPNTGLSFGGLDLDEARDEKTNGIVDRAAALLDAFPTAYAEVSPSGAGGSRGATLLCEEVALEAHRRTSSENHRGAPRQTSRMEERSGADART